MGKGRLAGWAALLLFIAAAVAWMVWSVITASADMGIHGTIALVIGIVATAILAAILIGLMIYSNRKGFDDR